MKKSEEDVSKTLGHTVYYVLIKSRLAFLFSILVAPSEELLVVDPHRFLFHIWGFLEQLWVAASNFLALHNIFRELGEPAGLVLARSTAFCDPLLDEFLLAVAIVLEDVLLVIQKLTERKRISDLTDMYEKFVRALI